jgi:hypothetical protein
MKKRFTFVAVFLVTAAALWSASAQIINPPIPKGAVHLLVHNDAEAKRVFTYFPYPQFPDWYHPNGDHPDENYPDPPSEIGIYRLEVTPQGIVSAVTILKNANRMMDVISKKTLMRWRAKPGPLRIVDVFCVFGTRWLGTDSPMHPQPW